MSVTVETLIHCDGCGECHADSDSRHYTATRQRSDARGEGWIQRGKKDFCPNCKGSKKIGLNIGQEMREARG